MSANQKKAKFPIYIVIGTRAQFIKVAPLMWMMRKQDVPYQLIYSRQHQENIQELFDLYDLPEPDKLMYEDKEANTLPKGFMWIFKTLPQFLFRAKDYLPTPGIVITHGDTFTAWMAAVMGKLAGCKVAHLESGLRSFNIFKPFPEEISRLITFQFSDIYFCPNEWALNNLRGFKGEKVNLKLNPLYDAVKFGLGKKLSEDYSFTQRKYVMAAFHRTENILTNRLTDDIVPLLQKIAQKIQVVVSLHPTTRERLKSLNLFDSLSNEKNIILHERFDFTDWINLCNKAEFLLSDGGSNQEEFSYLGIPTLLLRTETERNEGLGENVVLSKFNPGIIDEFINNYTKYKRPPLKVKDSPSQIVINYLKEYEGFSHHSNV